MQALSWHHHPPTHACGCRQQLQHRAAAPTLPAAVCRSRSRHRSSVPNQWQQHQQRLPIVVAAAAAGSGGRSAGGQEQQQQWRGLFSQQQPQDGNAADDDEGEGEDAELDEYDELEDEDEGEWDEDEFEDEDEDADDSDGAEAAAGTPGVAVIPPGQTSVPFTPNDFVEVGRISRPHGIRGEVKVQLITDEPKKRLGTRGKRLWLKPLPASSGLVAPAAAAAAAGGGGGNGRLLKRVVVESGRVARLGGKGQRAEWAVKFEGVSTREQAATLAGNLLLLALCDREARPRGKDEFFVDQLVGLKAVDAGSGALLGVVTEVYESGSSYSLLRLRLAPDEADIAGSTFRSLLLPFVAQMVPAVDVGGGSMQVDLPEGMLETAGKPKQLKRRYTPEQQAQLRQQLATRLAQQAAWEQQQQQENQEKQ